jgi:hypothetical protein
MVNTLNIPCTRSWEAHKFVRRRGSHKPMGLHGLLQEELCLFFYIEKY